MNRSVKINLRKVDKTEKAFHENSFYFEKFLTLSEIKSNKVLANLKCERTLKISTQEIFFIAKGF